MSTRVALLTNIPAPYRLAFFRELSARCDLKVFFDSRTEPNRGWIVPEDLGFPHTYLRGFVIPHARRRRDGGPSDERYWQVRYDLLPQLVRFRPDLVISIEFGLRSIQAAAYCTAFNVPLIIWSEGTPHSEGWQSVVRRFVRRVLVARARLYWTNGVEASDLLESYGATRERMCEGMIGVNTAHLSDEVQRHLLRRHALRGELGVSGVVFLFSGQLVPRKGLKEFLTALSLVAERAREFSVVFLGEGYQHTVIEEWRAQYPAVCVVTLGFQQPENVPSIYAAADVFVMPTLDDNWSLVALEAAVVGLPQIFSRYNGATRDLMDKAASGVVIDPFDTGAFANALTRFLDSRPARIASSITRPIIDYYGPKACVDRAIQSFEAVRGAARPRGR